MTFVIFVTFVSFVASAPQASGKQASELIDRTLAIVGGQVITLSDVRTAVALRLVDAPESDVASATKRIIDRLLMLREVQRYAPPEPAEAEIAQALATVHARFASADQFTRALQNGGFTEVRLRTWIRDDLRIAAYLNQRFASVGVPTDEEVSAYYTNRRDEFERDRIGFEQAAPLIRARLSTERRLALIADWTADLRRRTTIVELLKP